MALSRSELTVLRSLNLVKYIPVNLKLFVYNLHRQGLAKISSYQLPRGGWSFSESVRVDMKSSEEKKKAARL